MDPVSAPLDALRADPPRTAVLVDYDGTLAPIVGDPALAVPLPSAGATLLALHERFGRVAVVSGRPVSFLAEQLPAALTLSGLYGLEQRVDGVVGEHPAAAGWRPRIDEVAAAARAELDPGVEVEHKGLSLTLHLRRHPEHVPAAEAWATATAARTGLALRTAKRSFELHPPVEVDKGTVVEELVGDLAAAVYVGDDVGDLAAFDGLDRLAARGCATVRVAVATEETSAALVARADVTVDGPEGALAFLDALLG
jgi:trehalose 6-phosphate phosphatase